MINAHNHIYTAITRAAVKYQSSKALEIYLVKVPAPSDLQALNFFTFHLGD